MMVIVLLKCGFHELGFIANGPLSCGFHELGFVIGFACIPVFRPCLFVCFVIDDAKVRLLPPHTNYIYWLLSL